MPLSVLVLGSSQRADLTQLLGLDSWIEPFHLLLEPATFLEQDGDDVGVIMAPPIGLH